MLTPLIIYLFCKPSPRAQARHVAGSPLRLPARPCPRTFARVRGNATQRQSCDKRRVLCNMPLAYCPLRQRLRHKTYLLCIIAYHHKHPQSISCISFPRPTRLPAFAVTAPARLCARPLSCHTPQYVRATHLHMRCVYFILLHICLWHWYGLARYRAHTYQ